MRTVYQALNPIDAHLVKHALEDADIPALPPLSDHVRGWLASAPGRPLRITCASSPCCVRNHSDSASALPRASAGTVSAFGSRDWDSDVSSDFERSYLAGVAAEIEVFDGHRKAQGVAAARADVEAAQAEEALARRQLALDLTQARLNFDDANARRDLAHAGVVSAEEALRLTRERYRQGAADISELLNAETALAASRGNDSAVLYEAATALSNLNRAQGLLAARHDVSTKED